METLVRAFAAMIAQVMGNAHKTSCLCQKMRVAIQREKTMKHWYQQWKIDLIEKLNPRWHQLDPETGEFIYDK